MARLIVNLNTGDVYSSFSEAARATGADPGNISKVVSGARRTAGGYTFAAIDPEKLEDTDLRAVKRAKLAGQTKAQKKRATQSRQKSRQKVKQRQKAEAAAERQRRKTEPKTTTEARKAARAAMIQANDLLKKADSLSRSGRASLEDLAKQMGQNKQGGFKTRGITGTEQALKQAEQRIKQILAEDDEKKQRDAQRWQDIMHLRSQEDAEEKRTALDNLADAFERLRGLFGRTDGRSQYKSIFNDIQKEADTMTPEQVQEVADLIDKYLNETKEASEEEMVKIFEDWAEKAGIYEDTPAENEEEKEDEFIIYGD